MLAAIAATAAGDARHALSTLELAHEHAASRGEAEVTEQDVAQAVRRRPVRYDRDGDRHYDTISAFIKSVRASDPDAALYYLAVMLEGGEDPVYIARRIAILASEDIGNADPRALELAVACARVVELVGLPECRYALSQATAYLALAPKSNTAATSLGAAQEAVRAHATARPPAALRDASYRGARELGSGVGYRYPHDAPGAFVADDHLPPELAGSRFYEPGEHGLEAKLAERVRELRRLRGRGEASSDDALAERRADQLDGQLAGHVLAVEDRVHLDDLERADRAGLGEQLHREVRLAVGDAAAHRRADAGRPERVHHVHVERDVDVRRAAHVLERAAHDGLHAEPVDLGDRVDAARATGAAARARPGRASGRRSAPCAPRPPTATASGRPRSARLPSRARRSVPCRARCPTGVVSGVLQSAWASNQIVADRAVHARKAAEHAERERVVAAEHERQLARLAARGDVVGDLAADDEDLDRGTWRGRRPSSSASIGSLGDGAEIVHADAELRQAPDELGVADRGGPHVDTAAALPEVERGAEHGDLRERRGGAHALTLPASSEARARPSARARPRARPAAGRRAPAAAPTTPPASRTSRSPAAWSHSVSPCS